MHPCSGDLRLVSSTYKVVVPVVKTKRDPSFLLQKRRNGVWVVNVVVPWFEGSGLGNDLWMITYGEDLPVSGEPLLARLSTSTLCGDVPSPTTSPSPSSEVEGPTGTYRDVPFDLVFLWYTINYLHTVGLWEGMLAFSSQKERFFL